jgi:hypothetical protein
VLVLPKVYAAVQAIGVSWVKAAAAEAAVTCVAWAVSPGPGLVNVVEGVVTGM